MASDAGPRALSRGPAAAAALLVGLACVLPACGARTGLDSDCPDGGVRECENECGSGVQACLGGEWEPCRVAIVERPCSTACGDGVETCVDGEWGRCSAPPTLPPLLSVVVRDFRDTHPDFEAVIGNDRGIVEPVLGPGDLPVYAGPTETTHGREAFDQWYRDVPGVNRRKETDLVLRRSPADPDLFVSDNPAFFPIDGELFGNEGREHNFHFTLQATATFEYRGGETFRFRGDDDVFVFVDRRLVIDLGGVHGTQEATVELDDLSLTLGERYPLHLFFAERHTDESSFTVETTLADPVRCE